MNASRLLALAGCLPVVALLAAGCAPSPRSARVSSTPAAAAAARLAKDLTGAEVRALLGPPAAIKPLPASGVQAERWSYEFRGATGTRLVPMGTQELPAINPLTGQSVVRSEPVYQNQDLQTIDTLHLLLINDRLTEWRVVRDETKKFQ